jgi:raffinose/stachyose/melibiose transport system substrate-binding protein
MVSRKLFGLLLFGIVFFLGSTVVFAGGQKEGTATQKLSLKVNVSVNDTEVELLRHKYVYEALATEHPEWDIIQDTTPDNAGESHETRMRTLIAAGNGLDVFYSAGSTFALPLINSKEVAPLETYLDKMKYWDLVIPSAKKTAPDGHIYAVYQQEIVYSIMAYNVDLFAKYNLKTPRTFNELKELVRFFKEKDVLPIALVGKIGWPDCMLIEGFAKTVDPDITEKIAQGKAKFSDEPYRKAAEAVKELMDLGAFSKNVAMDDWGEVGASWGVGQAAMYSTGTWTISDPTIKFPVGYFWYPVLSDANVALYGKVAAGGVKPSSGMFVWSKTKNIEEAAKCAVAVSLLSNRFDFVENGNPKIIYLAEKLGWKSKKPVSDVNKQMALEIPQLQHVSLIVQDAMPSAATTQGIMEASQLFMTGKVTVDKYLQDMDAALQK